MNLSPRWQLLTARLSLILFGVFVGFFIAEIALRIAGYSGILGLVTGTQLGIVWRANCWLSNCLIGLLRSNSGSVRFLL